MYLVYLCLSAGPGGPEVRGTAQSSVLKSVTAAEDTESYDAGTAAAFDQLHTLANTMLTAANQHREQKWGNAVIIGQMQSRANQKLAKSFTRFRSNLNITQISLYLITRQA